MIEKIMILHELKLAGFDISENLEKMYRKYGKEEFERAARSSGYGFILCGFFLYLASALHIFPIQTFLCVRAIFILCVRKTCLCVPCVCYACILNNMRVSMRESKYYA